MVNVKTALATVAKAKQQLAACDSIEEAKNIRNKAEAVRQYMKAANDGHEAQNHAATIKLLAERRLGELLAAMPKQHGSRPADTGSHDVTPSLDDLGITKNQSSRWQKQASVPEVAA